MPPLKGKGKKGKKSKAPPPPKVTTAIVCASVSNFIRSPLLEGFLRTLCEVNGIGPAVTVSSCAMQPYHLGEMPHPAAQASARLHGFNISSHRARMIMKDDLLVPLVILSDANDYDAYQRVKEKFNYQQGPQVRLLSDFLPGHELENLPDPYYAAEPSKSIEEVYQRFVEASPAILSYLQAKLKA